jgi:hypothetical protein
MRRKMRTILRDTMRADKAKRKVYQLIVLVSSALLALSMFFAGGDTVERGIADAMPLQLSYTNDNYFGPSSLDAGNMILEKEKRIAHRKLSEMFLVDLHALLSSEHLSYANFNEIINPVVSTDGTSLTVAGVETAGWFLQDGIEIEEEVLDAFSEGTVILPVEAIGSEYVKDGSLHIYSSGGSPKEIMSLKVIGTYQRSSHSDGENEKDDVLKTMDLPILWNRDIESILSQCPEYYGIDNSAEFGEDEWVNPADYMNEAGVLDQQAYDAAVEKMNEEHPMLFIPPFQINSVSFACKGLDAYNAFFKEYNAFTLEENRKFARTASELGQSVSLGLKTKVNTFGSVLSSIARVKRFSFLVLTGVWLLLVLSLYGFISYMQRGREREIFLFRSLGASRMKTDRFYFANYLLSALLPVLIGMVPGYLLSWLLSSRTASNSAAVQNEISALTGQEIITTVHVGLFDISPGRALPVCLAVLAIMMAGILVCTWTATRMVMKGKLSTHARGGIQE